MYASLSKALDSLTKLSLGPGVEHFDIHYFAASDDGSNSTTIGGSPLRFYIQVNNISIQDFTADGLRPKPNGVPFLKDTPQLNTLPTKLRNMIWGLATECGPIKGFMVNKQADGFQVALLAVRVNDLEVEGSENLTMLINKLKYWQGQCDDALTGQEEESAKLAKDQIAATIQEIFTACSSKPGVKEVNQ
ncbi:hypothetical protein OIDMADRAFT_35630 [Oidiodendron maius Zn]|uniref:Uncharacterized protein n=1 Tax=Oidiodendron maius (strain Zn) TaxID=913774 RepID=A0A0C3GBG1_OIDMZ|nr:hypothetical protein OIDMADRAFT_35630 [Oidiodendron maius Zn]